MATPPTQIRIPHDLLSRIDWAAKEEGLTRTAWLLRAAQGSLPTDAHAEAEAQAEAVGPQQAQRYRCPVHADFVVTSSNAQCRHCNRKVVPA